ncbi:hypothetical protein PYW07_007042 [Mythimna separata]|uniref:DUF4773 domain-containing protein n=1 Tax=Mythimna separata TaxID=271217 RepID=A0AAD7Z179_MYTSE|nr:hypothetical protein PYW07_007042 [Mythimna separata]
MSVKLTLSLLTVLAVAHCASILDFLNLEDAKKLLDPAAPETAEPREDPSCKWKCKGPACACCIDQNITSYDPSGAKCIHMRYLSKDEGFFVQISHGKKVDYEKIQASNPEPLCLVMGVLFQMCASFSRMATTSDGLRGCVSLEPGTIFVSQRKIPLGCFKANESLMEMSDPPQEVAVEEENTEESTDNGEDVEEFDPNKFFAGVYQTAQQSIALLSSLLETTNTNSTSVKPASSTESSSSLPQEATEASQRRGPKNLKHPNQL